MTQSFPNNTKAEVEALEFALATADLPESLQPQAVKQLEGVVQAAQDYQRRAMMNSTHSYLKAVGTLPVDAQPPYSEADLDRQFLDYRRRYDVLMAWLQLHNTRIVRVEAKGGKLQRVRRAAKTVLTLALRRL